MRHLLPFYPELSSTVHYLFLCTVIRIELWSSKVERSLLTLECWRGDGKVCLCDALPWLGRQHKWSAFLSALAGLRKNTCFMEKLLSNIQVEFRIMKLNKACDKAMWRFSTKAAYFFFLISCIGNISSSSAVNNAARARFCQKCLYSAVGTIWRLALVFGDITYCPVLPLEYGSSFLW